MIVTIPLSPLIFVDTSCVDLGINTGLITGLTACGESEQGGLKIVAYKSRCAFLPGKNIPDSGRARAYGPPGRLFL